MVSETFMKTLENTNAGNLPYTNLLVFVSRLGIEIRRYGFHEDGVGWSQFPSNYFDPVSFDIIAWWFMIISSSSSSA